MRLLLPALLLSAAGLSVVHAQSNPASDAAAPVPFAAADARTAVTKLADDLQRLYLFPDIGRRYAAMLRANLAAGAYDSFPSRAAFATKVTADLRAINPDGHLIVKESTSKPAGGRKPPVYPPPIAASGWLAPGVAYISFRAFLGDDAEVAAVKAFMEAHKDAKTLIIDARDHHGGGGDETDVMFSYLYPERTKLVVMDQRLVDGVRAMGGPNMIAETGPVGLTRLVHYTNPGPRTPLADAKVYLLTSKVTASAAEHLALSLKRTHRATLIGESTKGAGHFGQGTELGGGYRTFIGTGRTFDPDTGKDWEGVGVAPDIAVPADQALDVALKRIGVQVTAKEALAKLG